MSTTSRDALDDKVNRVFAGKCVRKDLVRAMKVVANVPVFVLEKLLGKYCASSTHMGSHPRKTWRRSSSSLSSAAGVSRSSSRRWAPSSTARRHSATPITTRERSTSLACQSRAART